VVLTVPPLPAPAGAEPTTAGLATDPLILVPSPAPEGSLAPVPDVSTDDPHPLVRARPAESASFRACPPAPEHPAPSSPVVGDVMIAPAPPPPPTPVAVLSSEPKKHSTDNAPVDPSTADQPGPVGAPGLFDTSSSLSAAGSGGASGAPPAPGGSGAFSASGYGALTDVVPGALLAHGPSDGSFPDDYGVRLPLERPD
jgi:hypothetical protein